VKTLARRQLLKQLGLAGFGLALSGCSGGDDDGDTPATPTPSQAPTSTAVPSATPSATFEPTPSASPTATFEPPSCILTPEQTQGPFFIDTGLLRRDITEGFAGAPLELVLRLVDAGDGCAPIRDAVVEAWHADAAGAYSGFTPAQGNTRDTTGETFLRGYQITGGDGRVEFATVYPGWYPGRTVHIHIKVVLDGTRLLTSQLYFPDPLSDEVYLQPPYDARGPRRTLNDSDGIFANGGEDLVLDVAPVAEASYRATFVLGIEAAPV
jgi:protocatechuate 3,4-dioxygenase beta subunit